MQDKRTGGTAGKGDMEKLGEDVGSRAGRALGAAADAAGQVAGAAAGAAASAAGSAAGSAADAARSAAGGAANLAGQAAGKAIESTAQLVGNVAERLGGWWSDRGSDEVRSFDETRDRACRDHFNTSARETGRDYEQVRPLYALGHTAARNPEYRGRGFEGAEPDLQRAWDKQRSEQFGEWSNVRGFVGAGFSVAERDERDERGERGERGAGHPGRPDTVQYEAGSGGTGVGFRGHSGGSARDSESSRFGNSGSTADGSTPTRDASAPGAKGAL
jgi:hypothetical protein